MLRRPASESLHWTKPRWGADGGAAGLTYGDLTGVSLEREYNFSDLARTLLMGEINFQLPCDFNELRVVKITHISTSALYA
jgi:hypothetical protein